MKVLEGNPGKRALNKNEPKPIARIPPCPKFLSKEAKREWRRISRELLDLGLLTVVDRAALAAYCQCWARWAEAEEKMGEEDFVMLNTTDKGYKHVSPWFTVANAALKQMRGYLSEFGLSPASRSRVTVTKEEAQDPYTEFLNRRKVAS
jgi:P27 family predicted phage terminase small subunit